MKIEKINDNKIRCTLTSADLAERNLKLSELAYGTEKARSLFQDMMLEANQQFGFNVDNAPLMVEAVPVAPDSIVLIITRVEDPQELDTRFAKFAPSGDDTDGPEPVQYSGADDIIDLFHKLCDVKNKAQEIAKKAAQKENEKEPAASEEKNVDLVRTFHFSTLDDVISSAKALNQYFTGSNSSIRTRQMPTISLFCTSPAANRRNSTRSATFFLSTADRNPSPWPLKHFCWNMEMQW